MFEQRLFMKVLYPHAFMILWISLLLSVSAAAYATEDGPLYFDVNDSGEPKEDVPAITPWKTVVLEPEYGGLWLVAGDMDGGGQVEIVSAENFNEGDTHYTSAVAAQKLDGTVLWTWGDPGIGRKKWHHDVACQIHDWDGDGANEVVIGAKGNIVELDGATGKEKRRFSIPEDASDCIVFCRLTKPGHPSDVLVKDRYNRIYAYNRAGDLLWKVEDPGGHRTAHQPRPMDVDGDGLDEIMAGYAMLNADGSVRWVAESKKVDLTRGHLDCARVLRQAKKPEDVRIVYTCCGANNIAVVDGHGKLYWEVSGHHFESVQVGRIHPLHPGPHILVDIDHRPYGEGPLWVIDASGRRLGQIITDYSRHHRLVDWTGDGAAEIVVGGNQGLYNHRGERIGTFLMPGSPPAKERSYETSALVGDMTGDGVPDVLFITPARVYIYKNEWGRKPDGPAVLGAGLNVTLY